VIVADDQLRRATRRDEPVQLACNPQAREQDISHQGLALGRAVLRDDERHALGFTMRASRRSRAAAPTSDAPAVAFTAEPRRYPDGPSP